MRCGTNLNLYPKGIDGTTLLDITEVIKRLSEAGFQVIDLCTERGGGPAPYLIGDDWERRVDEIGEAMAKYGMAFSQLHLPFHKKGWAPLDPRFEQPGFAEKYELCMERAYLAGEKLGVPWAVAHCINPGDNGNDREDTARINHEYYDKYVELGIKHGVGTAFENMVQGAPGHARIRYTAHQDDLIDYVDSYADPMVQICWDFGHANICGLDQIYALRKVGKRLKCVHVHDNLGVNDDHLAPFLGKIDWYAIADVLAEIGYEGDLSLEPGGYARYAPVAMQDHLAKLACESMNCLRQICEAAKERKVNA